MGTMVTLFWAVVPSVLAGIVFYYLAPFLGPQTRVYDWVRKGGLRRVARALLVVLLCVALVLWSMPLGPWGWGAAPPHVARVSPGPVRSPPCL